MSSLKAIEICAGAGGQALGLEKAGFDHLLAIELDEHASNTLKLNRPDWDVKTGDVADRKIWNPADKAYHDVDLLAGGVPCPPFTIAGKQLGASDERDLFAWAVEQVELVRPKALLLENVRGLSMPRFSGYRQHVLDRLSELGYVAEWRLLHASDFGVPQLRPRFVLVALLSEFAPYLHWPETLGDPPSVGATLLDLMSANGWEGAADWAARASGIAPTIVGGSKKHGGADLGPTRAKRAWAAMGVDGLGVANDAPLPGQVFTVGPKLTCDMVARIQGWNDDEFAWEFSGKKTSKYRQIGNAFPPPVAAAVGRAISNALLKRATPRQREISDSESGLIFRALRERGDFMTAAQIFAATALKLEAHELERHISLLSRDFEVDTRNGSAPAAYRLGEFKAFLGQDSHARHDQFRDNLSRIS